MSEVINDGDFLSKMLNDYILFLEPETLPLH